MLFGHTFGLLVYTGTVLKSAVVMYGTPLIQHKRLISALNTLRPANITLKCVRPVASADTPNV